jgi:hypothetical protein
VEGLEDVEALAGAVSEAGQVAACGEVCEGEWHLEWFHTCGEEVEGHTDLGAKAGGDAGERVEGAYKEGALAGEGF